PRESGDPVASALRVGWAWKSRSPPCGGLLDPRFRGDDGLLAPTLSRWLGHGKAKARLAADFWIPAFAGMTICWRQRYRVGWVMEKQKPALRRTSGSPLSRG